MEHHGAAPIEEQDQSESDASTISCPPSPVFGPSAEGQGVTDELASIQEELQTVLEYVDHGMLLKSFDTLSRLTDIVVTNCEKLGLASDGGGAIEQKAGFWTGLNNCWLFAFSHYGNARSDDQRIREPHLHHLHNNVQAWADALEKYGLVNYELGLWEQDILEAIEVCLINTSVFASSSTPTGTGVNDEDEEDEDGNEEDND
ncbi:hypothetical protein BGX29_010028 [Mortierella sp. GBA35]|nr:hypothetical protein BGX23_000188 [Mortierella sp. AD031]KAF9093240.1 hypothetical protein BGX29_010028 [Mortierella sp. GBA35]KAG0219419.1 hypothetical protein BGX33_003008 [Mortierella sp. NVP41]